MVFLLPFKLVRGAQTFNAALTRCANRPPRPSLSLVRGPPVSRPAVSGGGQTWRRVRGFWLTGWLFVGRAECVTSPPRLASLGAAPQRWASCCRSCRVRGQAPRAFGTAPRSGAVSWLLQRLCFALWSFETCDELHEGTRREPRRPNPRQEAHQTWGAARSAGGVFPHSAQPTQRAKRQPRTQRQVCPLSERSERWGAENAPSHPCYGAKARFRSRWFTMAGAVFGGRGLDRITRSRLPGGGSACVPRDPRPSRCRAPDIRDRMGSRSDARGRRASRAR